MILVSREAVREGPLFTGKAQRKTPLASLQRTPLCTASKARLTPG
jgi:hypothetical protein